MEMYSREGAEKRRNEALTNGNAPLFFKFSEELGMMPETPYERDLYELGHMESISEKLRRKKPKLSRLEREAKDGRLIIAVESERLNFYSPESDMREKERIIKEILGYGSLRTGKGRYDLLENCKPKTKNSMLKREYEAAKERARKHTHHTHQ